MTDFPSENVRVLSDIPSENVRAGFLTCESFEDTSYEALAAWAYKAPLNSDGVAVLPSDWADDE